MLENKKNSEVKFLKRYEKLMLRLRGWVLNSVDVDVAISYAYLYGEIRTFNHDGVYADDEIEQHIESLVMKSGRVNLQSISDVSGDGVLVLASELFDYGGHTKVLLTWLEQMKDVLPHKLVVACSLTERAESHIRNLPVEIDKIQTTGLNAVLSIVNAAIGFNRVVMLTHPQDIVSVVAARILAASGYQLIFYNHADHVFTFGLEAAHVVCEISAYGEVINQRTNRVKGIDFRLGVPLKCLDLTSIPSPENLQSLEGFKVVLSVGTSYKFKPDEVFTFADFIDQLLSRRADTKVVLVGPTGKEDWWKERSASWGDRVLFFGMLPQSDYFKLLKLADIYVDSYPVTGGTAFPEALLAGKTCIGLLTPVNGYTVADELKVESSQALVQEAINILDRIPENLQHIENIRVRVASLQSVDSFKARILEVYAGNIQNIPSEILAEQKGLDSFWLEMKWRASGVIIFPRKRTIAAMPIFRMIFLILCLSVMKFKWFR